MADDLPASLAVLSTSRWRNATSALRSTIVGKVTIDLASERSPFVAPEPIALFDRLAPDGRHVLEASELMPWTSLASVAAYGGPLRLTLERDGRALVVVTASARSPAGYSMASNERATYAVEKPARGADGLMSVPDQVDGRYFLAAPKAHQFDSLRGDEEFLLEVPGARLQGNLPGVGVVVIADVEGSRRRIALTIDMLAVDGARRRMSIISRAMVEGEVTVLAHELVPLTTASRAVAAPMAVEAPLSEKTTPALSSADVKVAPPKKGAMAKPILKRR